LHKKLGINLTLTKVIFTLPRYGHYLHLLSFVLFIFLTLFLDNHKKKINRKGAIRTGPSCPIPPSFFSFPHMNPRPSHFSLARLSLSLLLLPHSFLFLATHVCQSTMEGARLQCNRVGDIEESKWVAEGTPIRLHQGQSTHQRPAAEAPSTSCPPLINRASSGGQRMHEERET